MNSEQLQTAPLLTVRFQLFTDKQRNKRKAADKQRREDLNEAWAQFIFAN